MNTKIDGDELNIYVDLDCKLHYFYTRRKGLSCPAICDSDIISIDATNVMCIQNDFILTRAVFRTGRDEMIYQIYTSLDLHARTDIMDSIMPYITLDEF